MKILIKYFPLILCAVIGNNEFTHWLKIINKSHFKLSRPIQRQFMLIFGAKIQMEAGFARNSD